MPHDIIGWIHTIAAIIGLVTGSMILVKTKGTFQHKMIGRVYGISMLTVCITAFMIYRLHKTFGILHILALISTATLLLGMLPLYLNNYEKPVIAHLSWMYWSVIGLYSAFAAEIFTRLPIIFDIKNTFGIFYFLVGLSSGMVVIVGSYYFRKKKSFWEEHFGS